MNRYALEVTQEEVEHLLERRAAQHRDEMEKVNAVAKELWNRTVTSFRAENKAGECATPTVEEQLDRFRPKGDGVKFDMGKPPLDLINRRALEAEAQVMAYGANKYGRDNWRGGMEWSRLIAATLRHVTAFGDGEEVDAESGLSHLAHARCCLAFLIQYQVTCRDLDDRHGCPQQKEKSL